MTTVGIRELKAKLSEHLRTVRQGERIQITDRGTPIAEIVPPGWSADPAIPAALAQMAREGKVRLATRPRSKRLSKYPRLVPPGTVQKWLDEDRGGD
jgi:prevent-host-death family protein